jgi:hypothetical protein
VKKKNSSDRKSPSRMALHHTLPSNPSDCYPNSHLSLLRSLSDRKREVERMDAIATDGGWDLEGGGELYSDRRKQRSLGSIKQNEAA